MSREWHGRPERGTGLMMRAGRYVALQIGRPMARAMLHPITLYFVLFAPLARRASLLFFSRLRRKRASIIDVYRHIHCFSSTILDRVFLIAGRIDMYDVRVEGLNIPLERVQAGEGCILIGTHLGSMEILRALALSQDNVPIKLLMRGEQNPVITGLLEEIDPSIRETIINLSGPYSLIEIKEYLDRGYVVTLLGDRVIGQEAAIKVNFLGHQTRLPVAPFKLAAILNAPVIICFGIYKGGKRYDIHFELLTNRVQMDRRDPVECMRPLVEKFMGRIEYYVRIAPYNWFNFYDYWGH